MRTSGMIGGLGPESTVDYYRSIIARFRALKPDGRYPHVIINSLDVQKGIALLDTGRLSELTDYLAAGVELLVRAGADFGFIAANTPHLVFDEVERRSAIPLLSIVRVTCDYTKALGLKKVGLFGTKFTMRASLYPKEFQKAGIALVRPKEPEQEFIHKKYIGELLNNRFLPETRTEILNIAQRMRSEDGIEALVLAGTELPLLLRGTASSGVEFLDTSIIHVEAIVDELLRNAGATQDWGASQTPPFGYAPVRYTSRAKHGPMAARADRRRPRPRQSFFRASRGESFRANASRRSRRSRAH